MSTTAELITIVRDTMGEDSTTDTQVTDAQILKFLNQKMTELCADTNVLVSGWTTSTVASQEWYSVPSEYTSVEAIALYRTTLDNAKWFLEKVPIIGTDPQKGTGTPVRFAVWGLNVSGDNSPAFKLDPIPSDSGTNDLVCYGRQLPKTMVSGGQGPEVRQRWQYAVVNGAVAAIYRRFGNSSREAVALAQQFEKLWRADKSEAELYITLDVYSPQPARDTMGYTSPVRW